jgi:hypothetical protein
MAKPIRKTPALKGKQADKFIAKMIATEKRQINKTEKEFVRLIANSLK